MFNVALAVEDQTNTVALLSTLAEYALGFTVDSAAALETARHCLIDALGSGFDALREPECAALIGPLVPGALMPGGARVPGTSLELDPAQAAFCTGLMLCWYAGRSPWTSSQGAYAAHSLGALLAVADYQARKAIMEGKPPPRVRDLLAAMIKTLEIRDVLAADGTATVRLERVAATAVIAAQLGGALTQVVTATSYACIESGMVLEMDEGYDDGRRAWAGADAGSRAVRYACQAVACGASYLTSPDLEAVDLAGKLLGATPGGPRKSFGTAIISGLAAARGAHEAAQVGARFQAAIERRFPLRQAERIKALFAAPERLDDLPVNELLAVLVTNGAR